MIVRIINNSDFNELRLFRLKMLRKCGDFIGSTYKRERSYPVKFWKKESSPSPESCHFGLFDGEKLRGLLCAKRWGKDPSGKTALWGKAAIDTTISKKGYMRALYESRKAWTIEQGFDSAVMGIHAANRRSAALQVKHGAKLVCSRVERHAPSYRPIKWRWYRVDLAA